MHINVNKIYAIALIALIVSTSELIARKIPPNIAFATVQLYRELEEHNQLTKLSPSLIATYENLIAGIDTINDMVLFSLIEELRQFGFLERKLDRLPQHTR